MKIEKPIQPLKCCGYNGNCGDCEMEQYSEECEHICSRGQRREDQQNGKSL